ncbi:MULTISPECIES: ABC transporter ATP-binding protein [unclassified Paenibacillus]|uniref:ABC transporter ATP-binding protein n=1 Tax=unclassified Paenibacillus TaxID=185978 RepID=UPI002404B0A5|nr:MULTISPECIES: ABC transporter ATP-binding protein [unclassified Paenibacillus]MDF9842342.1 iron(III) transport system ATP-binding protein [Paenibacillus sp. PastF-2]MDF9848781.1 iron(III) transport system ATP-binding protein [Paenibacillus sp. PastM-2]MDF9855351.1 iron(III) transport system ATP-binding protein [Paenibacillus sp. PastF-1]MDH6480773.1 iron(III) transport system ATP-binding protein [Paenibacillus sp. PastH-2]MDH6508046.1 iron(III) transport system ATP-binding protein [Paenibac
MSVAISFKDIVKKYGDTTVIPELSLDIQKGEFFTLLGPSGCGKTTLLRMVAGFNTIEGGDLGFNDKVMNNVPPGKRNIGMVFQNYAIFPHLNVAENVAFGLQNRKVGKEEQQRRVEEILDTVQIEVYKNRMPKNLSGGQQQRVALARAIVINPDVLLMDEPLSNLDAQLRVDMRNAIKRIQREVGITTVYVTHDQEEAMAVSDRIAVMKSGIIQQVGTPRDVYQRPANLFVATFIGRTNVIEAQLENGAEGRPVLRIGSSYILEMPELQAEVKPAGAVAVKISVRPEEFVLSEDGQGLTGKVVNNVFLGLNTHLVVELENGQEVEIIQQSAVSTVVEIGRKVTLAILTGTVNVYDASGERNLNRGALS